MGSALSQFGRPGEMSPYWTGDSGGSIQGMIGFSVDDFIRQFHPPFPNYIKIDVDGLEWAILQGAKETLRDSRLRSLMVELSVSNQTETGMAIEFVEACGFSLNSRGEIQRAPAGEGLNCLFARI